MCDRTQEFLQLAENNNTNNINGIHGTNGGNGLGTNKSNIGTYNTSGSSSSGVGMGKPTVLEVPKTRTAFHEAASEIARGIHKSSASLVKLTKLVRQQGLFDDSSDEINTLIFRIKQDLDELNTKCDSAQKFVENNRHASSSSSKNQVTEFNTSVVTSLKTDLMGATKDFKTVLETRSSKMKGQQQRKMALTGSSTLSPMKSIKMHNGANESHTAVMSSPYSKLSTAAANGKQPAMDHTNPNQFQQQQLLFVPQANEQYYESRHEAVTEVEKTIGELGSLFKRLAEMIQDQQTLVERIDDDVEQAVSNAEQGHQMLLKAFEKASSNKAMFMKLFAIFGIFALFFIIFLL
jgi:syntaxin 5